MPIQQELWSLECSVVETVVSLLRSVTKHCLAGIQSHCPDKVDDIQAVRKSSTDKCNCSGQLLFYADQWKRHQFFHSKKLRCHHLFWESGSQNGTVALVKCHYFDKLILGVCILHPVLLSDVLGDVLGNVIGVTSNYSRDVKRGQMIEAKAEAEAKHLRPRSRPRSRSSLTGRVPGQSYKRPNKTLYVTIKIYAIKTLCDH